MTVILLAAVLNATAVPAVAMHEEGVIHLGAGEVPAGTAVDVVGEKLPENEKLRLELRGALATFALDTIRTDSLGVFRARIRLPAEADQGSYTVAVIAPDGDLVASADLALLPRVAVEETVEPAVRTGTPAGAARGMSPALDGPRQATAAMMDVPANLSFAEWAAVLVLVALALAGAWANLRRRDYG